MSIDIYEYKYICIYTFMSIFIYHVKYHIILMYVEAIKYIFTICKCSKYSDNIHFIVKSILVIY